jgi:hypothetical protein
MCSPGIDFLKMQGCKARAMSSVFLRFGGDAGQLENCPEKQKTHLP